LSGPISTAWTSEGFLMFVKVRQGLIMTWTEDDQYRTEQSSFVLHRLVRTDAKLPPPRKEVR
jgi:hypothetical protein